MKLIVGLGNPGKDYQNTRHNIGFMVIDALAKNYNITFKDKFQGLYGEVVINNEKMIFLKPQKYMNLSGEVIKKYVDYYDISIDDILIICDDLDMETGKIRLRSKGSSGGHNGLKNIELHLHTSDYKRLKIGIANNKLIDTKDYVLGKLSSDEQKIINESIGNTLNIIEDYLKLTFDQLMSKYN